MNPGQNAEPRVTSRPCADSWSRCALNSRQQKPDRTNRHDRGLRHVCTDRRREVGFRSLRLDRFPALCLRAQGRWPKCSKFVHDKTLRQLAKASHMLEADAARTARQLLLK